MKKRIVFIVFFAVLLSFSCSSVEKRAKIVYEGYCIPPVYNLHSFINNASLYQEEFYPCNKDIELMRLYVSAVGTTMYLTIYNGEFGPQLSVKETSTFFYDTEKNSLLIKDYHIPLENKEWQSIYNKWLLVKKNLKKSKLDSLEMGNWTIFALEVNFQGEYDFLSESLRFDGMNVMKYSTKYNENEKNSFLGYVFYLIKMAIEKYNEEKRVEYKDPPWMNPEIIKKYKCGQF